MFHLISNIYFQRLSDESIRIIVRAGENSNGEIVKDIIVSPEMFASVMASMCSFGEDIHTWKEALNFLKRPYPGDDAAFKRWKTATRYVKDEKIYGRTSPLCTCNHDREDSHKSYCDLGKFVIMLRKKWPNYSTEDCV